MSIELKGLTCAVEGNVILTGVDATIADGWMTAIIGPNGAGKSTMLRTIAGITRPPEGTVTLDGADVHELGSRDRARRIAFVAQEEQPPAEMLVSDFVALGRLPYRSMWSPLSDEDRAAVDEALVRVEMGTLRHRPCGDLSGGQRRRAALARGFAQRAPWLLLDEPTNHLDVRHQQAVLRLARDSGCTVVAAIHDLDLVLGHFDEVIVVHRGGLVAQGSPADVLDDALVADVFGVESAHVRIRDGARRHLVIEGEARGRPTPGTS